MNKAQEVYTRLINDYGFKGSSGEIRFKLKNTSILVNQNNVVGNLIEEWIEKWMIEHNIKHKYNREQSSPDLWLNLDKETEDWLEIKSFTKSPNFDIAAYNSFINLILEKPYKLDSSFLIIKYDMKDGHIKIEDCWLKKIWEICSPSEKWSIKVQYKKGVISNIRPATWYSKKNKIFYF